MPRLSLKRDDALLLDMLLAARDAQDFVQGMDEEGFRARRLHQNAVRSLQIIGEALLGCLRTDVRVSPASLGVTWLR